jgi:hypothetical protein
VANIPRPAPIPKAEADLEGNRRKAFNRDGVHGILSASKFPIPDGTKPFPMHFGVHKRMNTIITTSIALAVATTTSFANGGDWLELDQDIASMSSTINNTAGGVNVNGLIRNSYRDGGVPDEGGWSFEDVIVSFGGGLDDFTWRVSFDLATSGSIELEDAYVTFNATPEVAITWGQFNAPMFRSGNVDPEQMLFIDRSLLGEMSRDFDNGIAVSGEIDGLDWMVAAQNGDDGSDELLNTFARISYDIGNGAWAASDGSLHASGEEVDATIGLSYNDYEDDGLDAVIGLEFGMTRGPLSISAEFADGGDNDVLAGSLGESPLAFTVGYLFADNMEAAFRHEDRDTDDDENRDTFGLNYYIAGHNAKWAINYIDDESVDDEVIAINLTVGASR